jgi:hypothetical protein
MKQDFSIGAMAAFGITIEMNKSFYTNPFLALAKVLNNINDNHNNCFHSTQILESKYYDKVDVKTV